ncbi:MAG: homocitrate synthase [candidate division NC10 bacterium]
METLEGIRLDGMPYFAPQYWVSPLNYEPVVKRGYPEQVEIYDVTLRDGEQTPGVAWNEDERIRIALALEEMGIRRLEIGMPVVSETIPRAIKRLLQMNLRTELVALCRSKRDDIDLCADIGLRAVIVEHPINPYLCKHALDLSVDQLLERLITSISYAKAQGFHVNFFGWDAFRTSIPYLQKIYGTVVREAKPDSVTLTDTFGVALPSAVKLAVEKVREVIGKTPLEFHGHNEFGFGTAAALAAVEGGAAGIHSAINGLGERTGNTPTEEIVMALELLVGVKTGVDLSKIQNVSSLVAEIAKVPVPDNKPVVGRNLSRVESGLVTDIISRMKKLGVETGMAPFAPELIGAEPMQYVIGKGSGKANIVHYLEKNGVDPVQVTKEQMDAILSEVKTESRVRKAVLSERDLMQIVRKILSTTSR